MRMGRVGVAGWRAAAAGALAAALLPSGCGGEEGGGEVGGSGGGAPTGCQAPELALPDGSCIRPGVPPDGCAAGFTHDGEYGCEPILPAEDCAPGMMAVPGDTACRPVMPCAPGRWGDIPTYASTQYVDGSYTGGNSDGSTARPHTTIQAAVAAAAGGAVIAIAAGSYPEDVAIAGKTVRLWGVCPEQVEVVGAGNDLATIAIRTGADGTEVHGLAVRGPESGLGLSGSEHVVFDRVWVHDTGSQGIDVENDLGATSMTLTGSLVEGAVSEGVRLSGAQGAVEGTTIRQVAPRPDGRGGEGLMVRMACPGGVCQANEPAVATITASLIDRSHKTGLVLIGSQATVEASVVRRTQPQPQDGGGGVGIQLEDCDAYAGCDPSVGSSLGLTGSVVEDSVSYGLLSLGSQLDLDSTVIRRTAPRASNQQLGRALSAQPSCRSGVCDRNTPSSGTISRSLLEDSHDVGLLVSGAQIIIGATVIRRTAAQQSDHTGGRGINVQACSNDDGCLPALKSHATIDGSLVDQSYDIGLGILSSDADVSDTVVRNTSPRPSDGWFGDGLCVTGLHALPNVTITGSLIDDSGRAVLSNFGAHVGIGASRLRCADFAMEGEDYGGNPFAFDDLGDVLCGCPEADSPCVAVSAGLAPPEPL